MIQTPAIRSIVRIGAMAGLISASLALPTLAASVLPQGSIPTVDWGEWPIVAMLLLVIFVLLWRVEKHLEKKDDKTQAISTKFAEVMDRVAAGHSDAMESVKTGMNAIADAVGDSRAATIGALKSHEARIAVLAQALAAKGDIDPDKLEQLFDRIRRAEF